MRLIVTGAAGECAGRFLEALAVAVRAGRVPPPEAVLALDLREPEAAPDAPFEIVRTRADLTREDPGRLVEAFGADAALHAAALTGAAAEASLEATLALNLDVLRRLAEALARRGAASRLLLASAVAAIGDFPAGEAADERAPHRPRSAYGLSKALAELFLRELRRRGELDARALRLPTLLVRRGPRSGAPSTGFLSDLVKAFREDRAHTVPAPPDFRVAVNAGSAAAEALVAALHLPTEAWDDDAVANLPAFPITAEELIEALRRESGRSGPAIAFRPDPALLARAGSWPQAMTSRLQDRLGQEWGLAAEDLFRREAG